MGTRDVEEFALDSGGDGTPPPRPEGTIGRAARPRFWPGLPWVAASLALILGGVMAAPTPGAVVTPWGHMPGLGDEPALAWELETTEVMNMWAFRGVLVIAELEEVRGLDATTGEERWSVESKASQCVSDGNRLTCASLEDEISVINPVAGTVDGTLSLPGAWAATTYDDDLVVATSEEIQRVAMDGTVRWSTPLPGGTPVYDGPEVIDGWVLVATDSSQGRQPPLDIETGEPGDPSEVGQTALRIRDGAWLTNEADALWLFMRGGTMQSIPDTLPPMAVTSDPSLLDSEIPGTDADWYPLAVFPGVAIGSVNDPPLGSSLMAIDTVSGQELWRSDTVMQWFSTPIVDDDTLAAPVLDPEAGRISTVVALNVETGEERWRIESQGDVYGMTAGSGHLFLRDTSGISAWELGG